MTIFYHSLSGVFGTQVWMTTLYSEGSGVTITSAHATWGLAVTELFGPGTAPNTGIMPVVVPAINATRYTTYQLADTSTKKIDKLQTNINLVGTAGGQALPLGLAPRVRLLTGSILPPGTGRMYLPSVTTSAYGSGKLFVSTQNTIAAAVKAALLVFYGHSLVPGVFSRKTLQLNGITDISVSNVPGYIESREKPSVATYTTTHVFP